MHKQSRRHRVSNAIQYGSITHGDSVAAVGVAVCSGIFGREVEQGRFRWGWHEGTRETYLSAWSVSRLRAVLSQACFAAGMAPTVEAPGEPASAEGNPKQRPPTQSMRSQCIPCFIPWGKRAGLEWERIRRLASEHPRG